MAIVPHALSTHRLQSSAIHHKRIDHGHSLRLLSVGTFAILLLISPVSVAQMPGMVEEETPSRESETQVGTDDSSYGIFGKYWNRFMGPDSPYRPVILTILTLLIILRLNVYLSRKMEGHLRDKAFHEENVQSFMKIWRGTWKFVIAVLVIMAMSGSLRLLGLTAGFIGMMLGWSLQQPVTGLAAWLMIILKRPFKIGDRVIIAGITGDVTAITLTHVILNQVGGSIGGEERSGRGILIPNAILFQHVIVNYTLEQKYMLDEVLIRLTFDSDWERAKAIMIAAAAKVTEEIIQETEQDPFVRAEFLDWGILVRLRYQTIPARRQELSTNIIEIVLKEFKKEYPRVRFANPATTIRYRPDSSEGESLLPSEQDKLQAGRESQPGTQRESSGPNKEMQA